MHLLSKELLILLGLTMWLMPNLLFGQVTIVSPAGGDRYTPGDTMDISWKDERDCAPYAVEFSEDDGRTWHLIQDSLLTSCIHWKAPMTSSPSCRIRIWQHGHPVRQPSLLFALPVDSGMGTYAAFNSDGSLLATTGWDKKVRLWDAGTGRLLREFREPTASTLCAKFSPDDRELAATCLDSTLRFWDVLSGTSKGAVRINQLIWALAYSPDGKFIVLSDDAGGILLLDAHTKRQINRFEVHGESIRDLSFTGDGRFLVTASTDRSASLVETEDWIPSYFVEHHLNTPNGLSPSDCASGVIPEKETVSQQSIDKRKNVVNSACFLSERSVFITNGFDGFTKFWRGESGAPITSKRYHGGSSASSLSLHPSSRWFLSTGYDSTAKVVSLESLSPITTIRPHRGSIYLGTFSPDGNRIVLAHTGGATMWQFYPPDSATLSERWAIAPE